MRPICSITNGRGHTTAVFLSRALKNATVVRGPGLPGALELVKSAKAEVFAANKPNLFEMSRQLPGSRVLDGRPGSETQAMLLPKGRDVAMAYARKFVRMRSPKGSLKRRSRELGYAGLL